MKLEHAACAECAKDLKGCSSILSAEGMLFCSRTCGVRNFRKRYGIIAIETLDMAAEEVSPVDIHLISRGTYKIADILRKRDDIEFSDAVNTVMDVRECLAKTASYADAENLIADELGLEMDYLFDLID